MAETQRFRVLIAGGGIAGVEALLAVSDLAGDLVEVTLVSPAPELTYKPLIVDEPFTSTPAGRWALEPIVEQAGGRLVQGALARVHPTEREAELAGGARHGYEAAVVCIGAKPRAAFAHAETLTTSGAPLDIDALLRQAAEHPSRRIAFVLPAGGSWPLPVYELALLSQRRAAELELDVTCVVVTPESGPLIAFGPTASAALAELLRVRGIEVLSGSRAREAPGGAIELIPGEEQLEAGAVVALPALQGPAVPGLPAVEGGFIPIDEHARVQGVEGVYAAGDGTNFPIKHGGLGTQQADAAAEHIAAAAGAEIEPSPFHPVIRGKLIVGDESLNLAADVTGGAGEGRASLDPLWWPPQKVAGRYLSALLSGDTPHDPGEPPADGIDIEVGMPKEWHREPMALDPILSPPREGGPD